MYEVIETTSYKFDEKFKGIKRNKPVEIIIETMGWFYARIPVFERPIYVEGVIEVTEADVRPKTPDPISQFSVSTSVKSRNFMKGNVRNSGRPDMYKDYIMTLDLGGPDVPFNIIPLWANFQNNADWRKFETNAKNLAMNSKEELIFQASAIYLDSEVEFNRASIPVGIYVDIIEGDNVVDSFRLEQRPSAKLSSGEGNDKTTHEKLLESKSINKPQKPSAILQGGIFKQKLTKKVQDRRVKQGLLKLRTFNLKKPPVV
ncbi:MAG: hypothetical protein DIZ80_16725 [endosymbiont of Galathealinum brachiosum]|uniref:Uncharacterized protein n=1 Tax=endosymbiont of Galathealinum brachiosum TaxID=2200906 RepID=A0A370D6L3_9GAMM|nr:MAG: hypothetical protein DIZ80_16725 [endosymbiont of Galathealinum brachiosum]